ncbi:hypothetical protein HK405_014112 [Cladochytrium tenue]|nr:hypothetical protein HK405_014112 [Cladochytrium tenue]
MDDLVLSDEDEVYQLQNMEVLLQSKKITNPENYARLGIKRRFRGWVSKGPECKLQVYQRVEKRVERIIERIVEQFVKQFVKQSVKQVIKQVIKQVVEPIVNRIDERVVKQVVQRIKRQ